MRARRWYLIAWDVPADDWRVFRVDRVERPFANGVRVPPRELPAADAAAFLAARLRDRPRPHSARVLLHADLETAQQAVPPWTGRLVETAAGVELHAVGDRLEWLAAGLALLDVDGELLEASPGVRERLVHLQARVGRLLVR